MGLWLLWLEGIGHRTCLAVQQRFRTHDSNADLRNLAGASAPATASTYRCVRSLIRNMKEPT